MERRRLAKATRWESIMKTALIRSVAVALLAGPVAAHATLVGVTSQGDPLVYDDSENVYWTADGSLSGIGNRGQSSDWVYSLNVENYGGFNNWTLPTGDGTYFANGLSTSFENDQLGWLMNNEGVCTSGSAAPFINLFPSNGNPPYILGYWSSSNVYEPTYMGGGYRYLSNGCGLYEDDVGDGHAYAIAVRTPEPATLSLLAVGVVGLGLMRQRRRNTHED
jgi:hypothetical protein